MLDHKILTQALNYATVWIAYSGGVDSHVLLKLAAEWHEKNPSIQLKAVHINHHISPNADAWALHCKKVCAELQISLHVISVQLTHRKKLGLEAAARAERYRVFAELVSTNGIVLTAHNANDQAETVLLQLLRGAGPKGLAAMPELKNLGQGALWRPLLGVPRAEIEAFAKEHQLEWIEDESNQVEDFTRNFLRQQIMPKLLQQWPACLQTLARSAEHCAAASGLLDELAKKDLLTIQGDQSDQIKLTELRQLSTERQNNVLRFWFKSLGFALPEAKQLKELREHCVQAKHDAQPLVKWANVECRRFAGKLYAMPPIKALTKNDFAWPEERELLVAELGANKVQQLEKLVAKLDEENGMVISFRKGGERCQIPGRKGTHELKKLFQEWKIPPWERGRIPLVYRREDRAFLVGVCSSSSVFSVSKTTTTLGSSLLDLFKKVVGDS